MFIFFEGQIDMTWQQIGKKNCNQVFFLLQQQEQQQRQDFRKNPHTSLEICSKTMAGVSNVLSPPAARPLFCSVLPSCKVQAGTTSGGPWPWPGLDPPCCWLPALGVVFLSTVKGQAVRVVTTLINVRPPSMTGAAAAAAAPLPAAAVSI